MTSKYGSGYYAAAAPKKRPPVYAVGLAVLLLVASAAVVLDRRGADEARVDEPNASPADRAHSAEASLREEELLRENELLRAQVARLESTLEGSDDVGARVRELEAENTLLRAEVERHRQGLQGAIAELNARGGSKRAAPVDQSPDLRSRLREGLIFVEQPYAALNMGSFNVSGEVRNNNPDAVSGFVVLRLLSSGKVRSEKRLPLKIRGKGMEEYFTTIPGGSVGSSYEVTASWEMAE